MADPKDAPAGFFVCRVLAFKEDTLNYVVVQGYDPDDGREDVEVASVGFASKEEAEAAIRQVGGNVLEGPYEVYNENGQLEEKGTYKDGERDGPHEVYYENGHLSYKRTYKDGVRDGPYESYDIPGQLNARGTYRDGVKDGPYEIYFRNGQLWEKSTYKDGVQDGPYEMYLEDGELEQKGTYKDNKRCGEWFKFGETVTYDPCPPDLEDGN
tara:strand:- start:270 stop:902 length:633 start_codon:yes stop_codon:yes gene_type:complete